jgi:hypothetical protein
MAERHRLDAELKAAIESFSETAETYDNDGQAVGSRILEHFQTYLDPEERRANEIKAAARDICTSVRLFSSSKKLSLQMDVGFVGGQMTLFGNALQLKVISDSMERVGTGKALNLDDYMAPAQQSVELAVRCITIAQKSLELRTTVLAECLGEKVEISGQDILAAMVDVATTGLTKKGLELAGGLFPGVALVLTAFEYYEDVKDRLAEMKSAYRGRGAEDDLFEFRQLILAQDDMVASLRETITTDMAALEEWTKSLTQN